MMLGLPEDLLTPTFGFAFLVCWAAGWCLALSFNSTKPIRHGFYGTIGLIVFLALGVT